MSINVTFLYLHKDFFSTGNLYLIVIKIRLNSAGFKLLLFGFRHLPSFYSDHITSFLRGETANPPNW